MEAPLCPSDNGRRCQELELKLVGGFLPGLPGAGAALPPTGPISGWGA